MESSTVKKCSEESRDVYDEQELQTLTIQNIGHGLELNLKRNTSTGMFIFALNGKHFD